MPSIHLRSRSPYYYAAFRGPDGRRMFVSTKQTERSPALAFALELSRAAKLAKRGELVETQARELVNGIMARTDIGESIRTITIEAHFRQWHTSKEARKSAETAERYGSVVDRFLTSLRARAKKPLTALVASDVEAFLDSRLKQGMAPRTVIFDGKTIRMALNAARRKGLIPTNPGEAVELPEAQGTERGTFTAEEVRMLVDTAEGEWRTIILFAYYTGARLGDCCRVSWDDVDMARGSLTYTQGKTGHKLTVPLHPDLLAHLEELAGTDKPAPFITPHMAELRPGGRHGLSEGFKRIMRKAGLDLQTVKGSGVRRQSKRSFHALRHTFTSGLANAGVSPEQRMKLTGHKSERIHQGYTHHELETLRAAVDKLPALNTGQRD